jgi:hypothetical protein
VKVELAVYQNGDDALLVWNVEEKLENCRGFAIERELTRQGKTAKGWLPNYVGFAGEDHKPGESRPSTEWPFQGFKWTDHEVGTGDSARYRVVPVVRGKNEKLETLTAMASAWSPAPPDPNKAPTPYFAYFNRGYVFSQFMAHYLKRKGLVDAKGKPDLATFKRTISSEEDHEIRWFLSGQLRERMLELLKEANEDGGEVYAALFEYNDEELLGAVCALGKRAHLVLSNGSITKKDGETSAEARKRDENEEARKALVKAKVDVQTHDRFISPGALGHNKFLVTTTKSGSPTAVWTGSTNWSSTGLCTQLNNGLLVKDPAIAKLYLDQWGRLSDAESSFPPELVDTNSQPKAIKDATVWFSRTRLRVDLDALRAEVNRAKQAILFLMFQPGAAGVLADVRRRENEPGLFVRGVVSTLPKEEDEKLVNVSVIGDGKRTSKQVRIVEPQGKHGVAYWAEEVTRGQFSAVGIAIVHSKVLVIDPFSEDATVVTGSHNFSLNASEENDENFMIIRRNRPLAEAYLVNIYGAWRHYRSRIAAGDDDWPGNQDDDTWMSKSLRARDAEAGFWGF